MCSTFSVNGINDIYFFVMSFFFRIVVLFINCISLFSSIILHFMLLSSAYFNTWMLPKTWSILVPIPPIIVISSLFNSIANFIAMSVSVLSFIGLNSCIVIDLFSLYFSKISLFTVSKSPTICCGFMFISFSIFSPLSQILFLLSFLIRILFLVFHL